MVVIEQEPTKLLRKPSIWHFVYDGSLFPLIALIMDKKTRMATRRSILARFAIKELVTRCFTFFHWWYTTYSTMEFPKTLNKKTTHKANTKNAFATSDSSLASSDSFSELTDFGADDLSTNASLEIVKKINNWTLKYRCSEAWNFSLNLDVLSHYWEFS